MRQEELHISLDPSITDRVHRNEIFVEIIPVFSTFSKFFKKEKYIQSGPSMMS